ncbi:hypothetical protein O181_012061 [Austropuccinia psidii MF-1]|uniref:Uncharacterized protein n=1 Tax=Austropuccinia psidii MF-1 TaxID=1389203 RepID=A0A9Q3GLY1_9BASI|nr:hypothetical protein [Austropuccinia psidii MF-1]
MPSGSSQRPPDQVKLTLPLSSRGRFPIPPCTPYSRMEEWCIYGIIYHCAPFFLSNPMVMLSGSNSMIPKSITNFEGGLFSSSVWKYMEAIRRPFHDPNHLALQELDW